MAVETAAPPVTTGYPAIFRAYIVRSTAHILAQIQTAPFILPPEARDQALHTLSYALKLPEAWPDCRALLATMAPRMEQAGYRDEWRPYLEEGVEQSRQLGDAETAAELHQHLGTLYELQSNYETARTHFETAARAFAGLNAPRRQARALNRLAYVVRLQRDFDEAARLTADARRLLEPGDAEQAFGDFVLGLIALDKRNWAEAVEATHQALETWRQEGNRRMQGRCLLTLAAALLPLKRYDEAIAACRQAMAAFEEIQDPIYRAIARMHLGNVYLSLGQPAEALPLYSLAKEKFRQTQYQLRLGMVQHNIGLACRQLEQWDQARRAYSASADLYEGLGNVALLVDTMDGLGLTYLGEGRFREAAAVFEDALRRLQQIEGEPGFEHLFETLSGHLSEAAQQVARRQTQPAGGL